MKLPCDPQLVSRYHDGELLADEREVLEDHLRGCGECRAVLAGMRKMSAVFDRAEVAVLTPMARARILRSAVAAQRSVAILSMARPFAMAAGLILALGLPLLVLKNPNQRANAVMMTPTPATWETTLLVRDADPARSTPQIQFAEFVANDLATARR
jgi:anti-sigma factor RsiW